MITVAYLEVMEKYISIFIFCFVVTTSFSQKVIQKELNITGIKNVVVDGIGFYKITIASSTTKKLTVKTTIEGEYAENTLLEVKTEPNTLTIGKGFVPFFEKDNDKLAAHKVESLELEITIPENLNVTVSSDIGTFNGSGRFDFLTVALRQGACQLHNFVGNAAIKTNQGDIYVQTVPDSVSGIGNSTYGTVKNTLTGGHQFLIEAQSTQGDITLLETH